MLVPVLDKPIRVGIFDGIEQAHRAIDGLLRAGFTKKHITVVCSDPIKKQHFSEFEHQRPAGTMAPIAVITGGGVGAILGGLAALFSSAILGAGVMPAVIVLIPAGA